MNPKSHGLAAVAAVLLVIVPVGAAADEGFWLPGQVADRTDGAWGKDLSFFGKEWARTGFAGLVKFDRCAGVLVSPKGLMVTSRACAAHAFKRWSDLERQGFLAKSLAEEPTLIPRVPILLRLGERDVTEMMQAGFLRRQSGVGEVEKGEPSGVSGRSFGVGLSGYNIAKLLDYRAHQLEAACDAKPGLHCRVASYFGGSMYQMAYDLEINDLRLVYLAPGEGPVTKEAAEFVFFRAYTNPSGEGFKHGNTPLDSPFYAPLGSVNEGDAIMAVGFPALSHRAAFSREATYQLKTVLPFSKNRILSEIELLEGFSFGSKADSNYAMRLSDLSEARQLIDGALTNFAGSELIGSKMQDERRFRAWLEDHHESDKLAEFAGYLKSIDEYASFREDDTLIAEAGRSVFFEAAVRLYRFALDAEKPNSAREAEFSPSERERFAERLSQSSFQFDARADQELWLDGLRRAGEMGRSLNVIYPALRNLVQLGEAERTKTLAAIYRKSKFAEPAYRAKLAEAKLSTLQASEDPFVRMAGAAMPFLARREQDAREFEGRQWVLASQVFPLYRRYRDEIKKPLYSDADGSLRVMLGKVLSNKKRSESAPASSSVHFVANLDRGFDDLGSPTFDRDGRLVGLMIPLAGGGMFSSWYFDERTTQSVHLDVRTILDLVEKRYPSPELLKELTLAAH